MIQLLTILASTVTVKINDLINFFFFSRLRWCSLVKWRTGEARENCCWQWLPGLWTEHCSIARSSIVPLSKALCVDQPPNFHQFFNRGSQTGDYPISIYSVHSQLFLCSCYSIFCIVSADCDQVSLDLWNHNHIVIASFLCVWVWVGGCGCGWVGVGVGVGHEAKY